jgi:hypothetical protein
MPMTKLAQKHEQDKEETEIIIPRVISPKKKLIPKKVKEEEEKEEGGITIPKKITIKKKMTYKKVEDEDEPEEITPNNKFIEKEENEYKEITPNNNKVVDDNEITALRCVILYLKNKLNNDMLQQLSDCVIAINIFCRGNGRGLIGGTLTDMYICEFFEQFLDQYEENHFGESDVKICGVPLSFKKVTKKTDIALDWSKNPNPSHREYFKNDIMVLNLFSVKWWATGKNRVVYAGIYLIDKNYCKTHVKLTTNNKSNSIVKSNYLYDMLMNSYDDGLFIPLPCVKNEKRFYLINSFK